jgi:hypothetical protein
LTVAIKSGFFALALAVSAAIGYSGLTISLGGRPGPLKLSDIALTRSIRMVVPLPPPSAGGHIIVSEQLPPTVGIAITEIGGVPHHGSQGCPIRLQIAVEGTPRASVLLPSADVAVPRYEFDPPIVVKPGEVVTLTFVPAIGSSCPLTINVDAPEFSIGGWKLEPGDV